MRASSSLRMSERKSFETLKIAQQYKRVRREFKDVESSELVDQNLTVPVLSLEAGTSQSLSSLPIPNPCHHPSLDVLRTVGVAPNFPEVVDPDPWEISFALNSSRFSVAIEDNLDIDSDIIEITEDEMLALEDEVAPFYCDSDEGDLYPSDEEFLFEDDDRFISDEALSESSSATCSSEMEEVKKFLGSWAVEENITHKALSSLAKGLKTRVGTLARLSIDARTILRTPRNKCEPRVVEPGEYFHIGLKFQLQCILTILSFAVKSIDLLFGIDGLPLFKSSSSEVWPILFSCPNLSKIQHKAFPVGIYFGPGKPQDVAVFLDDFIKELTELIEIGFLFKGKTILVRVLGFCCDLPARVYILGTVGHTGFCSCGRCTVVGKTVAMRRVFLDVDCPLRTDEDFRRRRDTRYQPSSKAETPLIKVPSLNFISNFILDPMHLLDLGVMRKLMVIWCCGGRPYQLSLELRNLLSAKLLALRSHVPSEFVRLPRELKELRRWKATEFRSFLLYLGIFLLPDILTENKYQHFLAFSTAISILSNSSLCKLPEYRQYARQLLRYFVLQFPDLYASRFVTHNLHTLIHLVDDCDYYTNLIPNFSLYRISAYPFENFLQTIKTLIRGKAKPLQQIIKRFMEAVGSTLFYKKYLTAKDPDIKYVGSHSDGPVPRFCSSPQFKKIVYQDFTLSADNRDNCCTMDTSDIVLIENIVFSAERESQVLVGRKFLVQTSFYSLNGFESLSIGICKVRKLEKIRRIYLPSQVLYKNVRFPLDDSFIIFPLHHTCTK